MSNRIKLLTPHDMSPGSPEYCSDLLFNMSAVTSDIMSSRSNIGSPLSCSPSGTSAFVQALTSRADEPGHRCNSVRTRNSGRRGKLSAPTHAIRTSRSIAHGYPLPHGYNGSIVYLRLAGHGGEGGADWRLPLTLWQSFDDETHLVMVSNVYIR